MSPAESIAFRSPVSDEITYLQRATWAMIPGKGRGVVAAEDISAGSEIERAPVVVVPASDLLDRDEPLTVPDQYYLYWSDREGAELAMGGGLLMFYNHSTEPNVEFDDGPLPDTMSVYALRDIKAGEELVYDYGCELWFDPS
jgi:SET domain-containing protein